MRASSPFNNRLAISAMLFSGICYGLSTLESSASRENGFSRLREYLPKRTKSSSAIMLSSSGLQDKGIDPRHLRKIPPPTTALWAGVTTLRRTPTTNLPRLFSINFNRKGCSRRSRKRIIEVAGCGNLTVDVGECHGFCSSRESISAKPILSSNGAFRFKWTSKCRCCRARQRSIVEKNFRLKCAVENVVMMSERQTVRVKVSVLTECRCRRCLDPSLIK